MTRKQIIDRAKKHGVPDCVFAGGLSKVRLQQQIENWFDRLISLASIENSKEKMEQFKKEKQAWENDCSPNTLSSWAEIIMEKKQS